MYKADTIAALATPRGSSGVAVIRVSGPDAFLVLDKVFVPLKKRTIKDMGWSVQLGRLLDEDKSLVDEVVVSKMPSPASYTTEDVFEISCHGSMAVVDRIIELLLASGCRLAQPGEFTKRAFVNGRIDLSQSEAILDLINSKTQRARASALDFLSGSAGLEFVNIKNELADLLASIEAKIDFPEEDDEMQDISTKEIEDKIDEVLEKINVSLSKAREAKVLSNVAKVAIVGAPNVGKSSLLNSILGRDRAIVSDEPGTTRDTIEELKDINGLPIKLVDTAGLRDTVDNIEKMGVSRAYDAFSESDVSLVVYDASRDLESQKFDLDVTSTNDRVLFILNKTDLPIVTDDVILKDILNLGADCKILNVSAKSKDGVDELSSEIESIIISRGMSDDNEDLQELSGRRVSCLIEAKAHLLEVKNGIKALVPVDILSIDIRQALENIGDITGDTAREDIISLIFSKFCIGK